LNRSVKGVLAVVNENYLDKRRIFNNGVAADSIKTNEKYTSF